MPQSFLAVDDAAEVKGCAGACQVHRVALTLGEKPVEYRVSTVNTALHDYVSVRS